MAAMTYTSVVERGTLTDRWRAALALAKRQEALLAIPSRIQRLTREGQYDQLMREYLKARALIAGMAGTKRQPGGFFAGIMQEVEKVGHRTLGLSKG